MVIDGTCYLRGLVTGGHGGGWKGVPLILIKISTPSLICECIWYPRTFFWTSTQFSKLSWWLIFYFKCTQISNPWWMSNAVSIGFAYRLWGIVLVVLMSCFMAGPKPMLTEFGIQQRLESCVYHLEKSSLGWLTLYFINRCIMKNVS